MKEVCSLTREWPRESFNNSDQEFRNTLIAQKGEGSWEEKRWILHDGNTTKQNKLASRLENVEKQIFCYSTTSGK